VGGAERQLELSGDDAGDFGGVVEAAFAMRVGCNGIGISASGRGWAATASARLFPSAGTMASWP